MATSTVKPIDVSSYIIPPSAPFNQLNCKEQFSALAPQQQLFAHHLSKASWHGSFICLFQISPESPYIFLLLQRLFSHPSGTSHQLFFASNQTEENIKQLDTLLLYAAGFFTNMGNYKSFGDSKIIPDLSIESLHQLIKLSKAYTTQKESIDTLWSICGKAMCSLTPDRVCDMGFPPDAISTYYSENITKQEAENIQKFMDSKEISSYNTRLFKHTAHEGDYYELRLASVDTETTSDALISALLGNHEYDGYRIKITLGDYSHLLKRVVASLTLASQYSSNETEKNMLKCYIDAFQSGSTKRHKDGSSHWVTNKGPIVEMYIGFIESYRDPLGVRGEFEGFVAVVNYQQSLKFGCLVDEAVKFIKELPWPAQFEKDSYLKPDFTSLDVMSYGGSGIPAGINIPNYDDIRQNIGFKNVSLGNVLSAHSADQIITFLSEDDKQIFSKLKAPSFEVQVGLHELLGHGSGKLFVEDQDGTLNFDAALINPLTGKPVGSWYKHGETWDSKFKSMGSSYEECRAECVGLYLCLSREILSIFGYVNEDEASSLIYVNWLNLLRNGLIGLEFYTPNTSQWRQAHMQARFVILNVLREAGVVEISPTIGEDGEKDLILTLHRDKIETTGKKAIGDFLIKLQVFKSTADVNEGQKLYEYYSQVNEEYLQMREVVMKRKQARRIFVQSHTELNTDGTVNYLEFDASPSGVVDSFMTRFPAFDNEILELASKDSKFWNF